MDESFVVPECEMPFPEYGLSSGMARAEQDQREWLEGHGLMDRATEKLLIDTRPEYTTAWYYPLAEGEPLSLVNRLMVWGFMVDDVLDDSIHSRGAAEAARCCDDIAAVGRGEREPSTALGRAYADIIGTLSAGRSPTWRQLLGDSNTLWLNTYPVEARLTKAGGAMPLEDFIPHRRHSVGEIVFMHLHEYVLGVELPAAVRNVPAMIYCRNRISEWVGLFNDLFSVAKEQAVGYPYNAVLMVRDRRGCTLQEAAGIANTVLSGLLRQFEASCAAIPGQLSMITSPASQVSADTMRVVEGYRHVLRGNYDYHLGVSRYADQARSASYG